MKRVLFGAVLCLALMGPTWADDYVQSVEKWRERRLANLLKPDGWLTLVGLDWLKEGENSFGSGPGNAIVFPKGPPKMGVYRLAGRQLQVNLEADVRCNGQAVTSLALDVGEPEGAHLMTWGSLRWYVIDRDGQVGIRLKDSESPTLTGFRGLEHFPIDRRWRVEGKFEPSPRKMEVHTVLGRTSSEESPGAISFDAAGKHFRVDVIQEKGDPNLFLIFGDATNGHGTYGGGRFLSVEPPDSKGQVWLDFNLAYSPPCAFTPYATCTLPPAHNRLSIAVEAGEKHTGH